MKYIGSRKFGVATKGSKYVPVGSVYEYELLEKYGNEPIPPEGQMVKRSDYPELYDALGYVSWLKRDEEEFQLPDLRYNTTVIGYHLDHLSADE